LHKTGKELQPFDFKCGRYWIRTSDPPDL